MSEPSPDKRRSAAWLLPILAVSSCCVPVESFVLPFPGTAIAADQCRMRSRSGSGPGGGNRHSGALLGACAFGAQPLHGWFGADSYRGSSSGVGGVPFPHGEKDRGRRRRGGGAEGPLRQRSGRNYFDDLDYGEAQQEEGVEQFLDGLEQARVSRAHPNIFLSWLCESISAQIHHVHSFDRRSDV